MTRRVIVGPGLLAAALVLGGCASGGDTDTSASGTDIRIEDVGEGSFTATGGAVAAGEICDAGEVQNGDVRVLDRSGEELDLQGVKQLTCNDGSGTFDIELTVTLPTVDGEWLGDPGSGTWQVVAGTGDYDNLSASGDLSSSAEGPPPDGNPVTDIYTGELGEAPTEDTAG